MVAPIVFLVAATLTLSNDVQARGEQRANSGSRLAYILPLISQSDGVTSSSFEKLHGTVSTR
jgi:hypothetical protein